MHVRMAFYLTSLKRLHKLSHVTSGRVRVPQQKKEKKHLSQITFFSSAFLCFFRLSVYILPLSLYYSLPIALPHP